MSIGIWILGDQLNLNQSALASLTDANPTSVSVLMVESTDHIRIRPYHQQKLILVWSAMRHFAQELRSIGFKVTYAECDEFGSAVEAWVKAEGITDLRMMAPVDKPFAGLIAGLNLDCELIAFLTIISSGLKPNLQLGPSLESEC